ncbi:lantibiotic dehydratase [Nocardia sp. NPDC019219]|uniref:lantibiotic dehydratase n=1 Tax=Nocardia sp. NPDC019219 TaxID=3154590 RepID=UPI0033DDE973
MSFQVREQPSRSTRGGTATLRPLAIARIAALPAEALTGLRSNATYAALAQIHGLQRALTGRGVVLGDQLYEVIGVLPPSDIRRRRLIGLRRSIHNQRRLSGDEWNPELRTAIPARLVAEVELWQQTLGELHDALSKLENTVAAERERLSTVLARLAGYDCVRRGIAASSEPLAAEVELWLARGIAPKRRKLERVCKFVVRAATKTTLYSGFTIAAEVDWTGDATASPVQNLAPAFVVDLEARLIGSIAARVADHPRVRPHLTVRVNPTATRVGEHILLVTQREAVVSVRVTPLVDAVVSELGATRPARPLDAAVRDMSNHLGIDRSSAAALFGKLIDADVLILDGPAADTTVDPVTALSSWLSVHHPTWDLTAELQALARLLASPPASGDVIGYRRWSHRTAQCVEAIRNRLHLPPIEPVLTSSPVHETAVLATAVPASSAEWDEPLHDLLAVNRVVTALDPLTVTRVCVHELLCDAFGDDRSVPFVEAHLHLQQILQRGDIDSAAEADLRLMVTAPSIRSQVDLLLRPDTPWQHPRLRHMHSVRQQMLAALRAGQTPGGIELSPETVYASASQWPEDMAGSASVAYYVQPDHTGGRCRFVLNAIHPGWGRNRSRIHHLRERAGHHPRPLVSPENPDGVVFAEIEGIFGAAFNQCTPAAPYAIAYPGVTPRRSAEQCIPMSDLQIRLDARRLTLHSAALRTQVLPVHNGMMDTRLLPSAARTLCLWFGAFHSFRASVVTPFAPFGREIAPGVRRHPRVSIGSVVLCRQAWVIDTGLVPRPHRTETDAQFLLRLSGWLHELALPERFFVRAYLTTEQVFDKRRKPLYIDVRNIIAALDAFRNLPDSPQIVLEEALPDPLPLANSQLRHVMEYVIELPTAGPRP